jgi:hypothetical protein
MKSQFLLVKPLQPAMVSAGWDQHSNGSHSGAALQNSIGSGRDK